MSLNNLVGECNLYFEEKTYDQKNNNKQQQTTKHSTTEN
jgi:hypothetical protein